MTDTPAIEFRSAIKSFTSRGRVVTAIDDVSFSINSGEIAGIIGFSGAGKSTLVRLINGLESPSAGHVLIDGQDIAAAGERQLRQLRRDIGMVFQQFNLFASRTVAGNVAFPLKVAGVAKSERAQRVRELLEFVGIGDKADAYPAQLSGGQKQRVGIARALATSPRILLADEATSALDPETTADILALLRRVNAELGTTIVVITHEMDVVRAACTTVAVLDSGRLVDFGDVYSVFAEPTSDTTRRLIRVATADVPTEVEIGRLRTRHRGTLVSLSIRDNADRPARLAEIAHRNGVTTQVVFGGITEVGARPFGSLTFELSGSPAAVDAVIESVRGVDGITLHGAADVIDTARRSS